VEAGIDEWFASRIPDHWAASGLEIVADQDEILVVVDLAAPAGVAAQSGAAASAGAVAPSGPEAHSGDAALHAVHHFRETTRDDRMALAIEAEAVYRRKVSWGARAGDVVVVFTTASVPVMTRLRLPERRVLDTLIDAGVARSRSDALAWCVRLVGDNEKDWIGELRAAFEGVEAARAHGPRSRQNRSG
jgi:hypothetical protein